MRLVTEMNTRLFFTSITLINCLKPFAFRATVQKRVQFETICLSIHGSKMRVKTCTTPPSVSRGAVHARHVHLVLRGGAPPFPPAAAAVATTRAVDAIRLVEDGVATRACGGGAVVFVPQKSPSATSSPGSRACRPRPCRAYPAAAAMSIPSELNRLWVTDEARHERPVDGGWG